MSGETSDVVVVLDTSRSLLDYYDEINGRILREVFTNYTKKYDSFHLISFSTYPRLEVSQTISSETDFSFIISKFLLSYPLAKDSDVILALDFIKNYLSSLPISRDKKLIFISDGFFTSSEYSNYTQDDFEKKLNSFSTHLANIKNIKTYYIKLPISSSPIVLDLQNDLSYFAKANHNIIEAYPLTCNLPSSLKEYLYFDELEKTIFIKKKQSLKTPNIFFSNTSLDDKHIKMQTNTENISSPIDDGYKEDPVDTETFIDKHKTNFEKYERKSEILKSTVEENNSPITETKLADENNFRSLSTYEMHSTEKKKNFDLGFNKIYVFLPVGFLLSLIVFFIIKKYSSKQKKFLDFELPTMEELEDTIRKNDDFFQMLENQYDEKELLDSDHNPSIEEHLNITKSPNTTTISENKKINISVETPKTLAMDSKTLTKSTKTSTEPSQVLKTIQKDEKILLNIKTMETKLNSEYSPTLFTLSPDTKKAFSKGNAIENMVSLLNTTYIDSEDIFYRFKHSLYVKKYIKNVDITKKNYIEMFVANQRRSIGMRNIHPLILNKTFYLGGGHDDFLIFLVPLPSKLASIHYEENEIILKLLKPKYFPYETELEIRNPIDRFFVITSEKNYSIHFMFRIYEKEIQPSSKIIHN